MSLPRLYQAATSSASWRVRIALALKAIPYDTIWLDLHRDDHLATTYEDVTPTRQVPCLEIDGERLFQSVAIIEYLDETRRDPPLLPARPMQRARVRAIAELVNSGIQPMHNIAVRRKLTEQFAATEPQAQAWCRDWIEHRFAALERALESIAPGTCTCGDTPTLADVFLYPQAMTSQRFGVDLKRFPALDGVAGRLSAIPAFRDSHAPGS